MNKPKRKTGKNPEHIGWVVELLINDDPIVWVPFDIEPRAVDASSMMRERKMQNPADKFRIKKYVRVD